jgi:predicted phage tail protein
MLLTLHFHPVFQEMTGVKSHKFDVNNLSDIKDALCVLFPKMRRYIKLIGIGTLRENLALVNKDGKILNKQDYYIDKVSDRELNLVPILAGSGRGIGLILGILLIGIALFAGGLPLILGGAGAGFVGATPVLGGLLSAGGLLKMGIGLALSGLMQLLMKPPDMRGADTGQRRNNDMFDAMENTTDPNSSVPLVYGMPRVAGQMLSGHVETVSHGESDTIYVVDLLYKDRSEIKRVEGGVASD